MPYWGNIIDILCDHAEAKGDVTAVRFLADGEMESASITFGGLKLRAQVLGGYLQAHTKKGSRILLLYHSSIAFIEAFIGSLFAGMIAITATPPKPKQSFSRITSIIKDAEPTLILTHTDVLNLIQPQLMGEKLASIPVINTDKIIASDISAWFYPDITDQSIAFLQYTSGSTGSPKGVMVSHKNLIANDRMIDTFFGQTSTSLTAGWLPIYHDMGLIGQLLYPIYKGYSSVFMPPEAFLQKPVRWLKMISDYRATISSAPNFAYDLCTYRITPEQCKTFDLSSWQVAINGAEPIKAETLERFIKKFSHYGFASNVFCPSYGMAEATLLISADKAFGVPVIQAFDAEQLELNKAVPLESELQLPRRLVSCGRATEPERIIIVDPDTREPLDQGNVGEIWIAGDHVACGYWQKEMETREVFTALLKESGDGPFLRTGDVGFFYDDLLYITGRRKDLIILQGKNYYPHDIERSTEESRKEIRSGCSAAFSIFDSEEEQLVILAEIHHKYVRKIDFNDILIAIQKTVYDHHGISAIDIVLLEPSTVKKTTSGKVRRRQMKKEYEKNSFAHIASYRELLKKKPPLTSEKAFHGQQSAYLNVSKVSVIQQWILRDVASVLHLPIDNIDIYEPLSTYGLSSKLAIIITGNLQEYIGRPLSTTLLWQYPTIDALSAYLAVMCDVGSAAKSAPAERHIQSSDTKIAVVGIGCRFPQAENIDEFWELLMQKTDVIQRFPENRIADCQVGAIDRSALPMGGYLEQVDSFDASFFTIPHREANYIDPQQRLLLEVAWKALENTGVDPKEYAGSMTGVFIGISGSDYGFISKDLQSRHSAYLGTGTSMAIAANRISYTFDLHGPSLAIDTACSSSLTAIHQACQSIICGESSMALAGGVNLILYPYTTDVLDHAKMMSPDGRCKTFDAGANGYVRGEGCAILVLKRYLDACRDNDRIYAVIRGSAILQDGKSNGLTAPNQQAQKQVINRALTMAKTKPDEVTYIETHGTGTALGDPIEVGAIKEIFNTRTRKQTLWIGALKTNIGHLEAAAGIAGVIKTILSIQRHKIPSILHFKRCNPYIDLKESQIRIATQEVDWDGSSKRIAGISAFGFGGTIGHIIIEEYQKNDEILPPPATSSLGYVLTISAKSIAAILMKIKDYARFVNSKADNALVNACYSVNRIRSSFPIRTAVTGVSKAELSAALDHLSHQLQSNEKDPKWSKQALLKKALCFAPFDEICIAEVEMIGHIYPLFKATLNYCMTLFQEFSPVTIPSYANLCQKDVIRSDSVAGTYLGFAIQCGFARLFQFLGVEFDILHGSGYGEFFAAVAARVIKVEDAIKIMTLLIPAGETIGRHQRLFAGMSLSDPAKPFHTPDGVIAENKQWVDRLVSGLMLEDVSHKDRPDAANELRIVVGGSNDSDTFSPIYEMNKPLNSICFNLQSAGTAKRALVAAVAALYVNGAMIDWRKFYAPYQPRMVDIPEYPYLRKRYWLPETS